MESTSAGSQEPETRLAQIRTLTAILVAITIALFAARGWAVEIATGDAEARGVVQKLGESIVAAMKINDLDTRRCMLAQSAGPSVDFKALGAGVLAYAEVQVPANQRAEIMEGLTAYIARIIIDEINQIHPDIAKLGASAVKSRNEISVAMPLAGPNRTIDAEWVVKNSGAGWRVTDIMVSGYSLTAHYGGLLGRRVKGSVEQLADMMSAERKLAPRFLAFARTDTAYAPQPAVQPASATPATRPVAQPAVANNNDQRLAPPPPRFELAGMQPAPRAGKKPIDEWKLEQLTDLLR